MRVTRAPYLRETDGGGQRLFECLVQLPGQARELLLFRRVAVDEIIVGRHRRHQRQRLEMDDGMHLLDRFFHHLLERGSGVVQEEQGAGPQQRQRQQHGAEAQGEAGAQGNLKLET